jgi:hypothetical protein
MNVSGRFTGVNYYNILGYGGQMNNGWFRRQVSGSWYVTRVFSMKF